MQLLESLNRIEVKGKDNLDILLGCMMAIEGKIAEQSMNVETNDSEAVEDGR